MSAKSGEMSVSIVIPAYNEEHGIGPVLERLCRIMADNSSSYEIIVVDDGSTDNTSQVASRFPVRLIRHSRNRGYGAALKAGVRAADHGIIITMDSDGQHDPADVPRFVELLEGCDMVVGARAKGSHAPLLRRPGKWLFGLVANYLAGTRIPDYNSGFRAFRRELFMRFAHFLPNGFSFTTTLTLAALKEGCDVSWVPIRAARRIGVSKVNPLTDGWSVFLLILRTIVLFDPLKVFVPISAMLFLPGSVYMVMELISRANVPDSAVLLISGSIMIFFFGLLADQIATIGRGRR